MFKNNNDNWEFMDHDEKMSTSIQDRLIGVIDASTDKITISIFTLPNFGQIISCKKELQLYNPQDGWYEQNPIEIIEIINYCIKDIILQLSALNMKVSNIISIGIANQRETVILWDKHTGIPYYNAIVWNDVRAATIVDQILAKTADESKDYFKQISGLPMHPYFSAFKIRWLKNNIPEIKKACREGRCIAGTVDSWIVWNLTGGVDGGIHITDVTNASRTFLMNIDTLNWDPFLLKTFSIHPNMLPKIHSSSEIYGQIKEPSGLNGINISAILGNQQAALLGHSCIQPGQTKCTYHSGCFMLCNTGQKKVISEHGLITTVAYKLGKDAPTIYALEGSVAVAGAALKWLQNNFGILKNTEDAEKLANSVNTTGDVYFVPAFTGLYAPYWRKDARGSICGITQFTTKNHIIRAAIESICFQNRDILECMNQEHGFEMKKLYTDGLLTANSLLMQLQADLLGIPIFPAKLEDKAALGAAVAAALADGINACEPLSEKLFKNNNSNTTYLPTTTDKERDLRYSNWKKAIHRCLGWVKSDRTQVMTTERKLMLGSIPAGIVLMSVFGILIMASRKMK